MAQGSSPHTRGAPAPPRNHQLLARIIPAYAGSTWPKCSSFPTIPDHPRIRGEHSLSPGDQSHPNGSSPHTRGARDCLVDVGFELGIIPAYAGSTSSHPTCELPRMDHPRIRGEHGSSSATTIWSTGSSPHTRGAPRSLGAVGLSSRIIPAYAGSTPRSKSPGGFFQDHPRIRGEHAVSARKRLRLMGSSPHTRGALASRCRTTALAGIIPAYAGSTRTSPPASSTRGDHPRIRGEHSRSSPNHGPSPGSSPHTRGARRGRNHDVLREGIIPAYAGSTCRRSTGPRWQWDHPRIRGEHTLYGSFALDESGSSPHTRGARCRGTSRSSDFRIIPAYAGSTCRPRTAGCVCTDHPRIRGEHHQRSLHQRSSNGSSPHTRGAHRLARSRGHHKRIIPAYAGSTCTSRRRGARRWDHPRIRGEHRHVTQKQLAEVGSSPHTRGALASVAMGFLSIGIIPAYAGSTRPLS